MRPSHLRVAALTLCGLVGTGRLDAQEVRKVVPRESSVARLTAGIDSRRRSSLQSVGSIDPDRNEFGSAPALLAAGRSRLVAGTASAFVPGLGSFYAGHARHGAIHLLVHVVAGTYVLAGSVSCISAWGGETDCSDAALDVAAIGWLVNWGWSIVSAINDASAFNARR